MKRLEEITTQVSGAKYFSTLDAKEGFWQVTLDQEISKLCTFITQWGKFRFLRMPYGISCASDEFQRLRDELFRDIPGVSAVVDDIVVAKGVEAKGVVPGTHHIRRKCRVSRESGRRHKPPRNIKGLQSFFGMTNFLSNFIEHYAD